MVSAWDYRKTIHKGSVMPNLTKLNEELNAKADKTIQTHIIPILDMSGSMGSIALEVLGSYNKFMDDQKKDDSNAVVSLVLFDNIIETPYTRTPLKDVETLTDGVYWPRGLTSLYDAIGQTIARFKDEENVILLIQTDGMDNTSKEYTQTDVKKLIEKMTNKGWDINFLGADIDVKAEAAGMGMAAGKGVVFSKSATGVQDAYASMNHSTSEYRRDVSLKGDTNDRD